MKMPTTQPTCHDAGQQVADDIAISVGNLTKKYRIFGRPADRIKHALTLGKIRFHQEFTALQDISFEIKKGETVGIIGRNGSGKSTLLQLICGILKPTSGSVKVNGRISALLELGAGFNPEFTGRENVYFQGAVMGLTRTEMEVRFDDIAAFADIGDFIDQPIRIYSSGMFVRLAFAVAISVNPDILVVDEALSVGDAVFQHNSRKRIQKLIDEGTCLLLVSHDKSMITSICSRAILLENGQSTMDGLPSTLFDYYYALLAAKENEQILQNRLDSGRTQIVSGTGEARVENIRLLDRHNKEQGILEVGTLVVLEFIVRVYQPIPKLALAFAIRDRLGQTVYSTTTNNFGKSLLNVRKGAEFAFRFQFHAHMGAGNYSVSTFLVSTNDRFTDNFDTRELAYFFEVRNISYPLFAGNVWLNPDLDILEH